MDVFVTGGSGFVGRNLITALKQAGYRVKALARSEQTANTLRELGAEPVMGDLDNEVALREGCSGCEWVFHAAAKVEEWGDYADFYHINVEGTERLLKVAEEAGVKRFIHVSSESVLLGSGAIVNVDESRPRPAKPMGLYSGTKNLAEAKVVAANHPPFETIVLRPRLIWGKGDTSLMPQMIEAVKKGRFMWINGGKYLSSTCHIANVCEGLILAAQKGKGGEIYFLTDGAPVEFKDFITRLLGTQGVTIPNKNLPRAVAYAIATLSEGVWRLLRLKSTPPITRMAVKGLGDSVTVNDSKARRELGYVGKMSIEQGLAEMG